jgi:RNA polymerase subunit RPABC4/transcription elongation factor Spt4
MALINCTECNREISDKAKSCPHCGLPIDILSSNAVNPHYHKLDDEENRNIEYETSLTNIIRQINCQFCGKFNDEGSRFCGYCGQLIDAVEIQRMIQLKKLELQNKQLQMQTRQLEEQRSISSRQNHEYSNMAKCPRCGSTSLSGNKKGFGVGKAVIGAAILGPVGLIAGNMGSKKVKITCLKCGKQFWA